MESRPPLTMQTAALASFSDDWAFLFNDKTVWVYIYITSTLSKRDVDFTFRYIHMDYYLCHKNKKFYSKSNTKACNQEDNYGCHKSTPQSFKFFIRFVLILEIEPLRVAYLLKIISLMLVIHNRHLRYEIWNSIYY